MNEQSKEAIVLKYYGENDWGQPIYQVGDKESFLVDLGMGRLEEPDFHWCSPKDDPYGEPDYAFEAKEGIEVIIQGPEEPEKSREEKKFTIAKMMAANEYQEGKTSVEWLDLASGIHDVKLTKELLTELKEKPMELVFDNGIGWRGKEQMEAMAVLSPYGLDSSDNRFRYQMLSRMQSDCNYYLGNGNRFAGHLWAKDEKEQIEIMKALYHSFHDWEKPEWITMENILGYEKEMSPKVPERLNEIAVMVRNEMTSNYGEDLGGHCIEASDLLVEKISELLQLEAKTVEGWCAFDNEYYGSDRPWDPHTWVEIPSLSLYLDVTADQFNYGMWEENEFPAIVIREGLPHGMQYEEPSWIDFGIEEEPERFIKISAGMTQEYEVIQTTAPDEVIIEQLKENNRLNEEGILIENPYEVIEAHGFSVECIGCQDDDELLEEIEIDAEFDSYDYEPELKDSLDAKIQSAVKACEGANKEKGAKALEKEMEK